jgi:hypothetical protein
VRKTALGSFFMASRPFAYLYFAKSWAGNSRACSSSRKLSLGHAGRPDSSIRNTMQLIFLPSEVGIVVQDYI